MELMSPQQVSDLLGTPVETLHYWRWKGLGPISVKIGRAVRYDRADVDSWVAARKAATSSGVGAA